MPDPVPNDAVSPNRGVMIVLAYLWLLALVPLLFEKTDREVQWHAKHGIVLMIAELVALLVYILVTSIISLATLGIGCILSLFLVFAWVGVLAHPFYATSGPDGSFAIKNLPPGTYTIEAWHEKLGTQSQTVTVGAGETKTADFTFSGPKA